MEDSDRQLELLNRLRNMLVSFMKEFDISVIEVTGILEFIKTEMITNTLYEEDEPNVEEDKDVSQDPDDLLP